MGGIQFRGILLKKSYTAPLFYDHGKLFEYYNERSVVQEDECKAKRKD